jgi:hypothetical protein
MHNATNVRQNRNVTSGQSNWAVTRSHALLYCPKNQISKPTMARITLVTLVPYLNEFEIWHLHGKRYRKHNQL